MPAFSSVTSLAGGLRINWALPAGAQEDLGGRVAALISQITILQSNLTLIQSAVVSANASGATFSGLSGQTFTTFVTISNFSST